jgi:hypothetical protein
LIEPQATAVDGMSAALWAPPSKARAMIVSTAPMGNRWPCLRRGPGIWRKVSRRLWRCAAPTAQRTPAPSVSAAACLSGKGRASCRCLDCRCRGLSQMRLGRPWCRK